ncbi:unnamed protein product [Porites evermanni]|uniref:K Homology domain-containing protein n=1 Tax=Porites evermanni TaxID=104178 RepID=A0ABN8M2Q4_9CNID|nr:unnamed protein product [Porites evermanni]
MKQQLFLIFCVLFLEQGMGMKRPAEEDYNSNVHAKRSRDENGDGGPQLTLRFLLQSKDAGGIIGKAGSNVKRLRSEFIPAKLLLFFSLSCYFPSFFPSLASRSQMPNCVRLCTHLPALPALVPVLNSPKYKAVVNVPDTNSPERVLTITAAQESAIQIFSECLPKIGERQPSDRNGKEIQMLVQRSQVGSVIGRGGYKIKETREQTGAQIKVFADCLPDSTERVVSICGSDDVILACVRNVIDTLNETPLKGQVSLYDPSRGNNWDYGGGFGGGPRGGGGRGGRDGGGRGRGGRGRGGRGGSRGGGSFGGGGDMGFGGNFNQDFGGGGNMGGGDMGGQWNQEGPVGGGEYTTTQVTIPKDLAGSIIGRGGQRIKEIRERSGATIKIDDPLPGSNDRIITISGNQSQINFGQFLLQQSVRQYSGKNF